MKIIPRIRPTLKFSEIIRFILNLLWYKSKEDQDVIISNFESRFSIRYNLPQGVCFSKARVAFFFLLKCMGLKQGGEILISAIHVADFVNMIRLAGFRPVVVDLLPNSYTIDYGDLERKINGNSELMLITHLSGYATDMDKILEISKSHNIPFIEDCSQAVSSEYNGRPLGIFGKAAIFSLSLLKPICTLSGGMVLSNDVGLINKLRQEVTNLRPHRRLPLVLEATKNAILRMIVNPIIFRWIIFPLVRLTMPVGDYFYRYQKTNKTVILRETMPPDFLVKFTWQQAIMGLSQLTTLECREKERIGNGLYLYNKLHSHPCITLPSVIRDSLNSFWLFPVLVKNVDKLKRFLAERGVDSSKFLLSLLCAEKAFKEYDFECESAKKIKDHTLFIPTYCGLKRSESDYIIRCIDMYRD